MKENEETSAGYNLKFKREVSAKTRGPSMQPLLKQHRDIVTIRRVEREIKRGDVVLYPYFRDNKYVLHRVIKVEDDKYIIRGDNNFFTEKVKKEKVVGILVSFIRKGKYCDCEKSLWYKLYTFWILNSYPLRNFLRNSKRFVLKTLSCIKHKIFK